MPRPDKPAGPAPSHDRLREAALRHLARFGATRAGLLQVLDRCIHRWAARAAAEGQDTAPLAATARLAARQVAADLAAAGAIDDAAFAAARASRLTRTGRSRRAVAAHLANKGVAPDLVETALGPENELPSALAYARRRRLGPFRREPAPEARLHDLAALARAGFPRNIAEQALDMDPDSAEGLVLTLARTA